MLLVPTKIGRSGIHGIGLFAAAPISEGTRIWEVTPGFDLRIPRTEIEKLPKPARIQMLTYSFEEIGTGFCVICIDDDRFTNHSDNPNTREIHVPGEQAYSIAIHDIPEGDEITCDYRTFDADWRRKLGR
ncbi:SET domain-containing protein-lysine N-methyltransferase [Candidatus Parcubacteria bacterium]|nr:MAG: SET domain-containing protein-lysine N-methyltransferase [Candidatus Parcubacteria bacterium]